MTSSTGALKSILFNKIKDFINLKEQEEENPLFKVFLQYVKEFVLRGKLNRGSIFLSTLSCEIEIKNFKEEWFSVAIALELIQSAFLIHDDIMDRSDKRRSLPSMHKKLELYLKESRIEHPDNLHNSTALAMVLGDYLIFLAQELLLDLSHYKSINQMIQKEWQRVCLYQMEDVLLGREPFSSDLFDRILKLYEWKTARYSFSLPFVLGWALLRPKEKVNENLFNIGIYLGILFQIYDDSLDFLNDKKETDKSIGTDIKENKKNIYLYLLYKELLKEEREFFDSLKYNNFVTQDDLIWIKKNLEKYKISKQVYSIQIQYVEKIHSLLEKNNFPLKVKELIVEILNQYLPLGEKSL